VFYECRTDIQRFFFKKNVSFNRESRLTAIEPKRVFTAKERHMSEWFFKSCVKFSICSAILFFFYHLFITQKLDEEVSTHSKEQE